MTKASHQAFQKRHHNPHDSLRRLIWATACKAITKLIPGSKISNKMVESQTADNRGVEVIEIQEYTLG
jgi:hypothetical protein